MRVGSTLKYSPTPPQTPAMIRFVLERCNFLSIYKTSNKAGKAKLWKLALRIYAEPIESDHTYLNLKNKGMKKRIHVLFKPINEYEKKMSAEI